MNLQTHKSDIAQFAQFQPEAEIYTEKKKKKIAYILLPICINSCCMYHI